MKIAGNEKYLLHGLAYLAATPMPLRDATQQCRKTVGNRSSASTCALRQTFCKPSSRVNPKLVFRQPPCKRPWNSETTSFERNLLVEDPPVRKKVIAFSCLGGPKKTHRRSHDTGVDQSEISREWISLEQSTLQWTWPSPSHAA